MSSRDFTTAALLFVLTVVALGWAQRSVGITRDEATYFDAAEQHWKWFAEVGHALSGKAGARPLTERSIVQHWRVNNEHPVLLKSLFALSWRAFHKPHPHADRAGSRSVQRSTPFGRLSETSAFRLPTWLITGLAVALIYIFGVRIEGRTAGLVAALLYATMPRLFFHGQLACFDSAMATAWLLVVYAYYRSLDDGKWGLWAGFFFGLALATKHNAWFIPALLIVHYLAVVWPDVSIRPLHLPRIPLVFVSMAILGPLVFWAHWPWLWFDTIDHIRNYFAFHMHHAYYNMEYLGTNYGPPPLPMSYPFVMTLFTVPTVTLLLAICGGWVYGKAPLSHLLNRWIGAPLQRHDDPYRYPARRSWRRPAEGLNPRIGTLLVLNAAFPIVLIALPSTPIFGGTKHWLPAYPFIALLAGVAFSRLIRTLRHRHGLPGWVAAAVSLLLAVPGATSIALTHPFGLSQYNALAGGPAGGADKGLNRQFWGYAPKQLLPWINATFADDANVYFHDVNYSSYRAYVRQGELRPDIRYAGMELPAIRSSNYALVVHELHFNKYDYWIWDSYGSPAPTKVLQLDGVPLVSVYQRNRSNSNDGSDSPNR